MSWKAHWKERYTCFLRGGQHYHWRVELLIISLEPLKINVQKKCKIQITIFMAKHAGKTTWKYLNLSKGLIIIVKFGFISSTLAFQLVLRSQGLQLWGSALCIYISWNSHADSMQECLHQLKCYTCYLCLSQKRQSENMSAFRLP